PAALGALYPAEGATAWMVAPHADKPAILGGGSAFGPDAPARAREAACREAGVSTPPQLHSAGDPLGAATALILQHPLPFAPCGECRLAHFRRACAWYDACARGLSAPPACLSHRPSHDRLLRLRLLDAAGPGCDDGRIRGRPGARAEGPASARGCGHWRG